MINRIPLIRSNRTRGGMGGGARIASVFAGEKSGTGSGVNKDVHSLSGGGGGCTRGDNNLASFL